MSANGRPRKPPELVKAFTPSEQKIGLGLLANLSYEDIGAGFGGITARTVRMHVEGMKRKIIGCEELEPRAAVIAFFYWQEWKQHRDTADDASST